MMSEHLRSQGAALVQGVSVFEPFIYKIHKQFKSDELGDWPIVVLSTTLQTSALSLFKLLPSLANKSKEAEQEPLDIRSIASIVRNIIDTHDAIDMFLTIDDAERYALHRNILGLYLSSRIGKVQDGVDKESAQKFYKDAPKQYWEIIKNSPLYKKEMKKLKNGESIYYESRRVRVEKACGKDSEFVLGVLADLSTYVHSVPPAIWMSGLENMYTNNSKNQDLVAIWLRISNVYFAQSLKIILNSLSETPSNEVSEFIKSHECIFQE